MNLGPIQNMKVDELENSEQSPTSRWQTCMGNFPNCKGSSGHFEKKNEHGNTTVLCPHFWLISGVGMMEDNESQNSLQKRNKGQKR